MAYERILLTLDGSGLAEDAIGHAILLARACGATVHLLYVQNSQAPATQSSVDSVDWRLRRVEVQRYLDGVAERVAAGGIAVSAAIREGRPAEQIVEYAEDLDIDLIVFSAYGSGGISRFYFGSTVQKVIGNSRLSFMIVRPGDSLPAGGALNYRRILVPVDGSYRAEWTACEAAAMLRGEAQEMLLLQVITAPEMPRRRPMTREEQDLRDKLVESNRRAAEIYLHDFARQLRNGMNVRAQLEVGDDIPGRIAEVAGREQVDLVVMSAHGARGNASWGVGTVCQEIMCHSPRPVLVLHDPAATPCRWVQPAERDESSPRLMYASQPYD